MVNKGTLSIIARNLGLVIVIVFPLWFALLWIFAILSTRGEAGSQWPQATAFYFVVLVPQLLLAGLLHQVVMFLVPGSWSYLARRATIIASALILFPVILIALGGAPSILLSAGNAIALGVPIAIYGWLARPVATTAL